MFWSRTFSIKLSYINLTEEDEEEEEKEEQFGQNKASYCGALSLLSAGVVGTSR